MIIDHEPAWQLMQVSALDEPTAEDHVPLLQPTHETKLVAPLKTEYVPATQLTQTSTEEAPTTLDHEPAPHDTHNPSVDAETLYVPATQS